MSAHPDDILVVAWREEARLYPQFKNSQVMNVASPERLTGRRWRKAYITQPASDSAMSEFWRILFRETYLRDGGEICHIDEYKDGE